MRFPALNYSAPMVDSARIGPISQGPRTRNYSNRRSRLGSFLESSQSTALNKLEAVEDVSNDSSTLPGLGLPPSSRGKHVPDGIWQLCSSRISSCSWVRLVKVRFGLTNRCFLNP